MTAPESVVRRAEPRDRDRSAEVLAAAFADDPVFEFILPSDMSRRTERLRRFFGLEFRRSESRGGAWTSADGAGVALWYPPGQWRASPWEMLRNGPASVQVFGRQLLVALRGQTLLEKHHPREPHWYLYFLGTDPARQGQGVGTAVMQPVLDVCDRDRLPAYLEATCERNRRLYLRHGFRDHGKPLTIPGNGPELYPMWRDPR